MTVIAALWIAATLRAQADAPSLARISSIPMSEGFELVDALAHDVDGDGSDDLVLGASSQPEARSVRRLALHLRRKDGPAFVATPDAVLELTPDVVAFAAGDVHADLGREILLFSAGSVFAWRWRAQAEAQRFVKLLDVDVLWQWPHRRDLFHFDAAVRDLDGDGLEDLAIPGPWQYGIAFQRRGADGVRSFGPPFVVAPGEPSESRDFDVERTPSVRQSARRRRPSVSVTSDGFSFDAEREGARPWLLLSESVPAGQLLDWDGDGDLDLAFLTRDHLRVFVQEPRGSFGGVPVRLRNPVAVDRRRQLDVSYTARALDLDLDKRFDCVISAGDKQSDDVRTQILVFLQRTVRAGEEPLFGKGGVPAQVLVLDGFARPLAIEDVDGDGLPDLVAGSIRPNLIDSMRAAASERLDAELYVYRNTKTGFSKRPDLTHTIRVQAGGLDFTARFLGDLTGDGVSEFVERAEKDKLRVHLVKKSRDGLVLIEKPIFEMVLAETARVMLPARIGRGSSDLFVLEKGALRCASFR
ncbi:MAG: FG-GAP repeat domain-containing protein [Planctomycetota bacterium]